jgi:hypothetical protein
VRTVLALVAATAAGAMTAGAASVAGLLPVAAYRFVTPGPDAFPMPATLRQSPDYVALPAPNRLRIPSIAVDTALERLDVDAAGTLNPPADFHRAGWFVRGPAPGDVGPAVIGGHVDSLTGPAVFFYLRDLKTGASIEVFRGGIPVTFRVVANERYRKSEFPTARVYQPTPVPELRLITCGGSFDRQRRSYEDNIVVYAVMVD